MPQVSTAETSVATKVDELGEIERRLAPFRLLIAREDALRSEIRAHYADAAASEPFEAEGTKYTALVGPKAIFRTVSIKKLVKALGFRRASTFLTCSVAALGKHAPEVDVASVTTSERTGPRSLKIFERHEASAK